LAHASVPHLQGDAADAARFASRQTSRAEPASRAQLTRLIAPRRSNLLLRIARSKAKGKGVAIEVLHHLDDALWHTLRFD
jgi:hypothetical protein